MNPDFTCKQCQFYYSEKRAPNFHWCNKHSPAFPDAERCDYYEELPLTTDENK